MTINKVWLAHYPEYIAKELSIPAKSIPEMFNETVENYPNHSCLSFYGKKNTYKEVQLAVKRFASALQKDGIQKGDRVAIMLPNCPQYVISYYGILTVGGIVTQINPMSVERELKELLNDSGTQTIVVLNSLYPTVKPLIEETNLRKIILVNLTGTEEIYDKGISFGSFLQSGNQEVKPVPIDSHEDVAILQYTGGTTGRSKGVMLTHRNLYANIMQQSEFFKGAFNPGCERVLSIIPFFHVYGMTVCINLSVFMANEMIILPRFEIEEVLNTIKNEQPTLFPGVPTMYIALINHPESEQYGIDAIKLCNSGSAPMPVELMKQFEKKTGATILEGYGLSEASPTTHSNPAFAARKPGTVGIPYPSTDSKIVDLASGLDEVPVGEIGELIIKGPQVMKGYWNLPEETANTIRDGWLYTGDIASVDEDGYVSILDRKKDMIIASGYNVYPREIEEVIYEHPYVKEAVVIGVPDSYRGETVKAVIVLKEDKHITLEEMKEYCKNHLATYKVPRIIEFRKELPKTNVGKILRRAIREEESSIYLG
ncbi:long-chain-fatty-acid--CoA ligase [Gottfriedia acidiceleris]|uniref:Long-chain fatty acid--CoA ligase n=1 Tax=Gottfriedia acidiceleris TaxID=371036 RepID=A0ABY4JFU7_9BACI|nr:long-chain fatty acid--CoA ligase [Gottfriedia acidiceleris]UPM52710.1 long-chain fatty acid--CoA ligase [Gottfriedia acidiceleris]